MLLQVLGCGTMSVGTVDTMYLGLALFLTGSGLNVTCINMMLTQRFAPADLRRESAFLWNYAGMNIGFFIGFAVAGHYQLTENYSRLFLFATIGNFLAIVLAFFNWKTLADRSTRLLDVDATAIQGEVRRGHRHPRRARAHRLVHAAAHRLDRHDLQDILGRAGRRARLPDAEAQGPARTEQHVGVPDPRAGLAGVLVAVPDGAERPAAVRRQQRQAAGVGRRGRAAVDPEHQHRRAS